MKLVKFEDSKVTVKAKDLLDILYAQKELGITGAVEFEQDDSEYDTLDTLRKHAESMSGYVIRLNHDNVEKLTSSNKSAGRFLVYIP